MELSEVLAAVWKTVDIKDDIEEKDYKSCDEALNSLSIIIGFLKANTFGCYISKDALTVLYEWWDYGLDEEDLKALADGLKENRQFHILRKVLKRVREINGVLSFYVDENENIIKDVKVVDGFSGINTIMDGRGVDSNSFASCVSLDVNYNAFVGCLHKILAGKKGKYVANMMNLCLFKGLLTKKVPYKAANEVFGEIGARSNYNRYIMDKHQILKYVITKSDKEAIVIIERALSKETK